MLKSNKQFKDSEGKNLEKDFFYKVAPHSTPLLFKECKGNFAVFLNYEEIELAYTKDEISGRATKYSFSDITHYLQSQSKLTLWVTKNNPFTN